MKRIILIMLVLIATLFLPYSATTESLIQDIHIEGNESIIIAKNGSFTCVPVVSPENAKCNFEWTSSDPSIATVKNGTIRGIKPGECEITCKALDGSEKAAVCHVTIANAVNKINLNEKNVVLLVGASEEMRTKQLEYTVLPDDTYWKDVTWSSSNEQVVTVNESGLLYGIGAGKATVTALSGQPGSKVKAQIQVVVNQAVEEIQLETDALTLLAKKNAVVKADISPKNASNKKIEWVSEDEAIASVSANGQIKGLDAGTTTIVAKATDGSGREARLSIRVCKPVLQIAIDGDNYDYAKRVNLTAKITNPDGSVDGLSELFPEAKIEATLQTAKGQKVKGFIVQSRTALEFEPAFSLADDNMKAGEYRIEVKTNVENLKGVSDIFHYTADKSWLPPISECSVELELSTTVMNLNEPLKMTATVTDTEGNPVPGVKVGFEVLTINRTPSHFFNKNSWLWSVTNDEGKCSIRSTRDEKEAKGIATGTLIVRAFIVGASGSDEKTFEFTGK